MRRRMRRKLQITELRITFALLAWENCTPRPQSSQINRGTGFPTRAGEQARTGMSVPLSGRCFSANGDGRSPEKRLPFAEVKKTTRQSRLARNSCTSQRSRIAFSLFSCFRLISPPEGQEEQEAYTCLFTLRSCARKFHSKTAKPAKNRGTGFPTRAGRTIADRNVRAHFGKVFFSDQRRAKPGKNAFPSRK